MKKTYILIFLFFLVAFSVEAQSQLNCDFTVALKACINQEVKVTYTGGASANATFLWNFDGAAIISGTGQGPYFIKWDTTGEKHITLGIHLEGQTCTATRPVVVIEQPALFHMTGGGVFIPGTSGVLVGLSGSQTGIIYKLRLNGQYTGVVVQGNGQGISFGAQTLPGNYTAVARVDGYECMREMEGMAVVTTGAPPVMHYICMVTFDTVTGKNKIIWNKHAAFHISHFNIFKETYQNNIFVKIGQVPYTDLSVFADATSDPLIKSDKYKISVTDSAGNESEKSPFHKTIHLNVSPGIFGFNLIWNHYEGFEFQTYRIHRKHGTGNWVVIDSVASNVDSYTDFYTTSGVSTYYIEVMRPEPCNPSAKSDGPLTVISNTATAAPMGSGEIATTNILAYPNPVNDKLNIVVPENSDFLVEILRLDGVMVFNHSIRGPKAELNVSDLINGLYILKITGEQAISVRKFVKN
jgi:hypothetical protein